MLERLRQPVPPLPARCRLLAGLGVSVGSAQALVLARRPGRHHPPAPGQDRRPHRRAEEPHPHRPADQLSRSGDPPPHPLPPAAPRHLNRRATCPTVTLPPTSSLAHPPRNPGFEAARNSTISG